MDFKQLQSFVSVVEYKSFTKASEKLYTSQPTVSTHIRMLEEELDTQLLIRTTKSLEVTHRGMELYEFASRILRQKDDLIASWSDSNRRIIHLGTSTIPSAYVLPEILPTFGELHPNTYFGITQGDSQSVIEGILTGTYDIGLIGMKPEDDALVSIPFYQDRMVIITPVNEHYLSLKSQDTLNYDELFKEPIILREKGSGSKKSADIFLEKMGISENSLNIIARINDQESIKNLVSGGLGISVISEKAAANFKQAKRILSFDMPEQTSTRNLYIVYHKNYILKEYITDFIEFTRNYYHIHEDEGCNTYNQSLLLGGIIK